MIFADNNTEFKYPRTDLAQVGAQLLISPLEAPANSLTLIRKHVKEGAQLIYTTNVLQYDAMPENEIGEIMLKMVKAHTVQAQRVLVIFDPILPEAMRHGVAGFLNKVNWWCDLGGVAVQIENDKYFELWIENRKNQLLHYNKQPVKMIYPSTGIPLQAPVDAGFTDWRKTLLTFPGMDAELVNTVAQHCSSRTLLDALVFLTDTVKNKNIPAGKRGRMNAIRHWLGLPEWYNLDLKLDEEGFEEASKQWQ